MKKILMSGLMVLALALAASAGQVVSGTFDGQTASPITIGVGFVPDWVKVYNVEAALMPSISWSVNYRSLEQGGGVLTSGDAVVTNTVLTNGVGISVYRGGDVLTTSTATNYLIRDSADQRDSGTGADVTKWTLTTNSTCTGYFDATPSTTYVGEGSRINIDGKWYKIISMDADATVDGAVRLSEAVPSGDVYAIRPMYDYKVAGSGDVMPAGFTINQTTVNASGNICFFEAGVYDEK